MKKTLKLLFVLQLLCSTALLAESQDFKGMVVGISDGDTISVMHLGQAAKIRLSGIDCPEKDQAFGTKAKQANGL